MAAAHDSLSTDFALSADQIAGYQRDGHTALRQVLPRSEAMAWEAPIREAVEAHRRDRTPLEQRTGTYQKAFVQVTNLWEVDANIRRFVFAKRFARIAAELMGVAAVRLYHDQALFKEPGGGHTPWHQDQYYWPIDTDNTITMWMPLVDCPTEMGPMILASGQHRRGALNQLAISDDSANFFARTAREEEWPLQTNELVAGDATFHSGWTPHKAMGNSTKNLRSVMTIIYHAADARVSEPANEHQPIDMARFFPGLKPGDAAASELNPVLWSR